MQVTAIVLSLLAIVCCQAVRAMFNNCTDGHTCIDIRECDFFGPHHTVPANWTAGQLEGFRTRICNKEKSGNGGNIYKVCCQKNQPPILLRSRIELLDLDACGPFSADRISRGNDTRLFEYPWMALLGKKGKWFCGGTLIHKRYVLTAAHCVKNKDPEVVRLGEFNLNQTIDCDLRDDTCADPPQDIPVVRSIAHEEYSARRKQNDIALLRLSREATLCDSVMPICLPVSPDLQTIYSTYFVAGWGTTENERQPNILQHTKLQLVPKNECQTQLRTVDKHVTLFDTQMCAKGEKELSINCIGDSGGPLKTISISSRFVQYGVVSFGLKTCGITSAPGVYTRVESYIDWILVNLEN